MIFMSMIRFLIIGMTFMMKMMMIVIMLMMKMEATMVKVTGVINDKIEDKDDG